MKIKKGDRVVVISGKDKGKEGVVTKAFPSINKVEVDGVNVRKVHYKPTQANPEGGIQDVEKPIDISNVMLLDGKKDSKVATRVGYKFDESTGKKYRYSKKTGTKLS
ncbi:MAG: 50S ribosomal protein L24 [Mycoplasmataceae bacterium]|nr:50S ribosomal protein L24 [Mycoplasmataceae bacterium]